MDDPMPQVRFATAAVMRRTGLERFLRVSVSVDAA
jgi:hypothetical protein